MEQPIFNIDKILCNIPFVNLTLILISNILVLLTWVNIFISDVDTMFLGLLLIPLFFVTIYYLVLLTYGIKFTKNRFNLTRATQLQNFALFLLNVVPMTLIYKLTTWPDDKKALPPTWVCGKWGWRKLLNIRNFIVLLFRLTETFWTLVSNSTTVIYIGGRSGSWVSNSPPATSPFRCRQADFWVHLLGRHWLAVSGDFF